MARTIDATDSAQIDGVHKLPGTAWRYLFGRALREFGRDQCLDLAAALTYRSIFALFPALLAMVSIIGLTSRGQAEATTKFLTDSIEKYGSADVADMLRGPIEGLATTGGAGPLFAIGVLGAIWTASNYVVSFGRAMNRIYDVEEGRPAIVLRPAMYLLTVALLIGAIVCAFILVLSGPVARAIGNLFGLGDETLLLWDIAKWPVLVILVIGMIACLYYFTPNVKRDRFPWLSVGAATALLVLALATAAFGFYLANFANYNKTYGSIGGVIALLLWIWIANSVLLFGAEIDAETERAKQLQSGLPAERSLQLPPRSVVASTKAAQKLEVDVQTGLNLRALANPITYEDVPPRHTARWVGGIATGFLALRWLRRRLREMPRDPAASEQTPGQQG